MLNHNIHTSLKDGRKIHEYAEWYIYQLQSGDLYSDSDKRVQMNIRPDADFVVSSITGSAADEVYGANSLYEFDIPGAEVVIRNTLNNDVLSETAIQVSTLFGIGGLTYIPPVELRYPKNSVVEALYVDPAGLLWRNVVLNFHGYRVYPS